MSEDLRQASSVRNPIVPFVRVAPDFGQSKPIKQQICISPRNGINLRNCITLSIPLHHTLNSRFGRGKSHHAMVGALPLPDASPLPEAVFRAEAKMTLLMYCDALRKMEPLRYAPIQYHPSSQHPQHLLDNIARTHHAAPPPHNKREHSVKILSRATFSAYGIRIAESNGGGVRVIGRCITIRIDACYIPMTRSMIDFGI